MATHTEVRASRSRLLRAAELGLFLLAAGCFIWSGFAAVEARHFQRDEAATLQRMIAAVPPVTAPVVSTPVNPGDLIGSFTIPRLHLSAMVIEGDDDGDLSVAIGHLPDTPLPWKSGNGNVALAAHRDTFFRPLKDVKVGDEIQMVTPKGEFIYDVLGTTIVDPSDVSVLDPTARPTLTLITCYPFSYVGHAPKRFIVRAERRP